MRTDLPAVYRAPFPKLRRVDEAAYSIRAVYGGKSQLRDASFTSAIVALLIIRKIIAVVWSRSRVSVSKFYFPDVRSDYLYFVKHSLARFSERKVCGGFKCMRESRVLRKNIYIFFPYNLFFYNYTIPYILCTSAEICTYLLPHILRL